MSSGTAVVGFLFRLAAKAYTAPQKPAARLTMVQWQHLQSVVAWSAPDREWLVCEAPDRIACVFLLGHVGHCRALYPESPIWLSYGIQLKSHSGSLINLSHIP